MKRRLVILVALMIGVTYLASRLPLDPVDQTIPPRTGEVPVTTEALALVKPATEEPTITKTPTEEPGTPEALLKEPVITGTPQGTPTATENPALGVKGTVTLWHSWNGNESASLIDIIAAFQDKYPNVQFDVLYLPFNDLRARFESAASTGGGPTVLIAPPEWAHVFYSAGLTSELSSMAKRDLLSKIHPVALEAARYQDYLIGIPYTIQGSVMFRNKSIIPTSPETLGDLIEKSTAATSGDVIGLDFEAGPFFSIPHLAACDGKLMEDNGDPAFNNEAGVCWLNIIKSFKEAGLPVEVNSDNDTNLFKAGRAGTIVDGTWNMENLAAAIGNDNLVIDPWPRTERGHMSGYVQTELLMLNANAVSEDAAAGWKFIEFFVSPEAQALLADPTKAGYIPVITGIDIKNPLVSEAYRALSDGIAYPGVPEIDAYWVPLESAIKSVVEQGRDPGEALQQAEDEVNARLEKLRSGQ